MLLDIDDNWISDNIHYFINRNVVIITGAGISVSSGIPDFRSKTGIFKKIKEKYKIKGENLFSYKFSIDESTRQIYLEYIYDLKNIIDKSKPSDTHKFFRWYSKKSNKMRIYTQNIDGLEEKAGLKKDNLVYLHGNLKNLKCLYCGFIIEFTKDLHKNFKSNIQCMKCLENSKGRLKKFKRYLHTDIIHYHQDHPDSENIANCIEKDSDCNLFIVVGTSMNVFGVRNMIKYFTKIDNKSILVNLDECKSELSKKFDYFYKGTSDKFFNSIKKSIEDYELDLTIQDISIHEEDTFIKDLNIINNENMIDKNINDKYMIDKNKNNKTKRTNNIKDDMNNEEIQIINEDIYITNKYKKVFTKLKRLSLTKDDIVSNFLRLFED